MSVRTSHRRSKTNRYHMSNAVLKRLLLRSKGAAALASGLAGYARHNKTHGNHHLNSEWNLEISVADTQTIVD